MDDWDAALADTCEASKACDAALPVSCVPDPCSAVVADPIEPEVGVIGTTWPFGRVVDDWTGGVAGDPEPDCSAPLVGEDGNGVIGTTSPFGNVVDDWTAGDPWEPELEGTEPLVGDDGVEVMGITWPLGKVDEPTIVGCPMDSVEFLSSGLLVGIEIISPFGRVVDIGLAGLFPPWLVVAFVRGMTSPFGRVVNAGTPPVAVWLWLCPGLIAVNSGFGITE